MLHEDLQNNHTMAHILILTLRINKDILSEEYEKGMKVLSEHRIHWIHESLNGIFSSKWHY